MTANDKGVPFTPLFIDGVQRPSSTNASYEVCNPYSGQLVGRVASASSDDCRAAIEAAGKAFVQWEHKPFTERRDIFLKAADLFVTDRYKEKIALAMREETAAVDHWIQLNTSMPANTLKNAAGMLHLLKGQTFPSIAHGGHVIMQRRAMGVIFAIAPWNAPVALAIRAVAVPLVCGNTVVLKSSEISPRVHAVIVELFHEAGLPNGVLNLVSIDKRDAPKLVAEIIAHPLIRKINFTGSDNVGKIIAGEAAKYLKPCVVELGGKSPAVVLDDADTSKAARAIVSGAVNHSGQICMSTERVIVQREAAKSLLPAIEEHFKKLKAGDPNTDPSAQLSALFSEGSAENILNMLKDAQSQGAEILVGDMQRQRAVVQPHLVSNVKPGMRLWERESFAPVVLVAVVDTVDEAVELANATEYSLAASLWTKNINVALDVAGRIRAGCTNINGPTFHSELLTDMKGLGGASGYGYFSVEHWTFDRLLVIHPDTQTSYPLVG